MQRRCLPAATKRMNTARTLGRRTMCWLFGGEPTLDEMLVDPTVLAVMKRDGVDPDDPRKLLGEMSQRVRHELSSSAGPDGTDADPSRPAGASSRQARR